MFFPMKLLKDKTHSGTLHFLFSDSANGFKCHKCTGDSCDDPFSAKSKGVSVEECSLFEGKPMCMVRRTIYQNIISSYAIDFAGPMTPLNIFNSIDNNQN